MNHYEKYLRIADDELRKFQESQADYHAYLKNHPEELMKEDFRILEKLTDIKFTYDKSRILHRVGIMTVGDLISTNKYDLLRLHRIGQVTVDCIAKAIAECNLDGSVFNSEIPKRPKIPTKPKYNLTYVPSEDGVIPTITIEGTRMTKSEFEKIKAKLEKTSGKTIFMQIITNDLLGCAYHTAKRDDVE